MSDRLLFPFSDSSSLSERGFPSWMLLQITFSILNLPFPASSSISKDKKRMFWVDHCHNISKRHIDCLRWVPDFVLDDY